MNPDFPINNDQDMAWALDDLNRARAIFRLLEEADIIVRRIESTGLYRDDLPDLQQATETAANMVRLMKNAIHGYEEDA
jgi:hypothetical protein